MIPGSNFDAKGRESTMGKNVERNGPDTNLIVMIPGSNFDAKGRESTMGKNVERNGPTNLILMIPAADTNLVVVVEVK